MQGWQTAWSTSIRGDREVNKQRLKGLREALDFLGLFHGSTIYQNALEDYIKRQLEEEDKDV